MKISTRRLLQSQISNLKSIQSLPARSAIPSLVLAALCIPSCQKETQKQTVDPKSYAIAPVASKTPPKSESDPSRVQFHDNTQRAGIDFVHVNGAFGQKWMPETLGSGAAFFDYDGDDRPDLLLVNSSYWPGHESGQKQPTSKLYRNKGDGTFEDVSVACGLDQFVQYGMGVAVADYDGDGDQDVYLTAVGKNRLLANDGGKFVDVTDLAGVGGVPETGGTGWEWSLGATWLDVDRDGGLDLFVCRYVKWTPETDLWTTRDGVNKAYATPERYEGESNLLFRNNGDGTFSDATQAAGVHNPFGKSMSVIADDVNADGWPDLVVTNDTQPNFLYVNQKNGMFVDSALAAGVAYDENGLARAGMGVDVADFANAGKRSIVIGNFSGEPLSLYTQVNADTFVDHSGRAQLASPTEVSLTFGVRFADFDLDGFVDLLLANGHIEPEIEAVRKDWRFAQRPQLFLNNRSGGFADITHDAGPGFQDPIVGRGIATADIDGDGDLDALLTTNGGRPRLLVNQTPRGPENHVIRIQLEDAGMNRDGIGSRLILKAADGTEQSGLVRGGGSYLSQSERVVTFGLGSQTSVKGLTIEWPTGDPDTIGPLSADRQYVIKHGHGVVREISLTSSR